MPNQLTIDGIDYELAFYRESTVGGDAMMIECITVVSGAAATELETKLTRTAPRYFTVSHNELDEDREMRFGKCMWSKDGDRIKHRLVLVDRTLDEEERHHHSLSDPELPNILWAISEMQQRLDDLLAALNEQGVLDNARTRALQRDYEKDELQTRRRRFFEVPDVDEWR